jgi:hypothetical protein
MDLVSSGRKKIGESKGWGRREGLRDKKAVLPALPE